MTPVKLIRKLNHH